MYERIVKVTLKNKVYEHEIHWLYKRVVIWTQGTVMKKWK